MIDFYFGLLSAVFAPLLAVPSVGILILASALSIIITLPYKFLMDQNAIKGLREEMKSIQKEIKEVQKSDPEKANKMSGEMFKLTNKQMMANMKPMMVSMVLIFPLLPWIASAFTGPIVMLPFSLPFFGNGFGWLMWYMIISISFSMFFRKLLDVI